MTSLILTRQVLVVWPFSDSKSSRAASKSVDNSSGYMLSGMAYQRFREWPIDVC